MKRGESEGGKKNFVSRSFIFFIAASKYLLAISCRNKGLPVHKHISLFFQRACVDPLNDFCKLFRCELTEMVTGFL